MTVIIAMLSIFTVFFLRYELVIHADEQWWRITARASLDVGLCFVLAVITMHYLNLIDALSNKLFVGTRSAASIGLVMSTVVLHDFGAVLSDPLLIGILSLTMLTFFVFGGTVSSMVAQRFPLPEKEKSLVMTRDPPKTLADLMGFHVVMLIIVAMPFIVKHLIWGARL